MLERGLTVPPEFKTGVSIGSITTFGIVIIYLFDRLHNSLKLRPLTATQSLDRSVRIKSNYGTRFRTRKISITELDNLCLIVLGERVTLTFDKSIDSSPISRYRFDENGGRSRENHFGRSSRH